MGYNLANILWKAKLKAEELFLKKQQKKHCQLSEQ